MDLTLYVPGLLLPEPVRRDTLFDLELPGLSLLLGRAQRTEAAADWLAKAFGVSLPLPAAALRKVGAGGTAEGSWICLDPVHWQVTREGITVADSASLELTQDEAKALIAAVQPLFADWGELTASAPEQWEMQLNHLPELHTRPLPDVIGLPVDPALPEGADGRAWRHRLAEAQTVLHAHGVNRNRDALGKPTINSLWPWGVGELPETVHADFDVIWSRAPAIAGLCTQAGIPCLATPDKFSNASGQVLACIDTFVSPARHQDALSWRKHLQAFEQAWIIPALTALKKKDLKELRLIATCVHGSSDGVLFSLTRGGLRRFWHPPRPLTALA